MENFLTAAKLHVHAKRFMDAYSAAMQPLSREFAIPQTAAEILLFLANNPENRTAKDICTMRRLKPGIVSLHVDTLVTLGFLERKSVPGDRRKLHLEPTEKASSIIARGRQMQERFAPRSFRALPAVWKPSRRISSAPPLAWNNPGAENRKV